MRYLPFPTCPPASIKQLSFSEPGSKNNNGPRTKFSKQAAPLYIQERLAASDTQHEGMGQKNDSHLDALAKLAEDKRVAAKEVGPRYSTMPSRSRRPGPSPDTRRRPKRRKGISMPSRRPEKAKRQQRSRRLAMSRLSATTGVNWRTIDKIKGELAEPVTITNKQASDAISGSTTACMNASDAMDGHIKVLNMIKGDLSGSAYAY
ncbi:hypothetical protein QBC39DRAFT_331212 [Podospora conica]|nr:hypothetical protein QBC39DRAFT_331212 [Schizothecium conicum]